MIPDFLASKKGKETTEEEVRRKLLALDLNIVAWKLYQPVDEGGYGWSMKKIKRAISYYRGFLFLCWKYPDESNVPNKEIDEVWHNHILFTKKYVRDCDDIFGRYVHHNPDFGLPPITEEFLKQLHD